MTKNELLNLYKLLSSSDTAEVGFKIAEGFGLNNEQLIKLMWCKMNKDRSITIGDYKLIKNRFALFTNNDEKLRWIVKNINNTKNDRTRSIPWSDKYIFMIFSNYLVSDSFLTPFKKIK